MTGTTLLIIVLIQWFLVMCSLWISTDVVRRSFDRLTKGKYRDDRVGLQIMLDHLRSFPEQWSISRDSVSFPLQGSKQIYLNKNDKDEWTYVLSSFDGRPRTLDGHFGKEFRDQIALENANREKASLLRNFYPELDGTLLLR